MVLLSVVILFMLPISEGVYDFRTDIKRDSVYVATNATTSTTSATLKELIYNADVSTASISSDLYTDVPVLTSYNSTNRLLSLNGLTVSANRTLTISYDYDVLAGWDSINVILDRVQWIWLLIVIIFAPSALVSMWLRRGQED
jgi:hypothetical protein